MVAGGGGASELNAIAHAAVACSYCGRLVSVCGVVLLAACLQPSYPSMLMVTCRMLAVVCLPTASPTRSPTVAPTTAPMVRRTVAAGSITALHMCLLHVSAVAKSTSHSRPQDTCTIMLCAPGSPELRPNSYLSSAS